MFVKTDGRVPNLVDYYTEVFSPKGWGGVRANGSDLSLIFVPKIACI